VVAAVSDAPRFSVVIPTLKRTEALRKTLENLLRCDPRPDEVVLVDADGEGSAKALAQELDGGSPSVRYLSSPRSLTLQRNRGIDAATGDVIVFLDDDVALPHDVFAQLARAYEDDAVVGATGKVVEPNGRRIGGIGSRLRLALPGGSREGTFTRYGYPRYVQTERREPLDVEYMLGCFMSARREAAAAVRFDETLAGYALAEDEDFSYRLSRIGRIRYLPGLVVRHEKFGFTSKEPRSFNRLVVRNRAYLFQKNFARTPGAKPQFALFLLMLLGHRVVNREWRGAVGVVEGVAQVLRARRPGL
jgi:GT2 family glycosyltransferase